jgi:anti-sigma B factor antagonist
MSSESTGMTFRPTRILSVASSATLLKWINRNLEQGNKSLLIDFSGVMFMDSMGLGTLITAHKVVQKAEGKLALCGLWGQARMVFEAANMAELFEIYDSPQEFEQALVSAEA